MDFWIKFWTYLLFGGLALFACMAISVAIGGIFNIITLFKSLKARVDQQAENSGEKND